MTIEAIVLDMDGTLFNDQKEITTKTKEALIQAQKNGIKLVLASGRPHAAMKEAAVELEMDQYNGLLISFNGAYVCEAGNDKEFFSQPLSIELSRSILEHLKKFEVKPMIVQNDYMYVNDVYDCMLELDEPMGLFNIIQYEARGGNFLLCEKEDLAEFIDFPLHKILIAGQPDYLRENSEAIVAPFKEQVSGVFSAPMYFEFTDQGIDKANALDQVLSKLNIPAEKVIAFGDGHNDLSIINYAGIGIAMDNAVPELKAAADKTTLSNNEDGIAVILDEFL
ncbi:Cof-type HAD-IIB family hydrolase [Enterococcus sp. LJL99]